MPLPGDALEAREHLPWLLSQGSKAGHIVAVSRIDDVPSAPDRESLASDRDAVDASRCRCPSDRRAHRHPQLRDAPVRAHVVRLHPGGAPADRGGDGPTGWPATRPPRRWVRERVERSAAAARPPGARSRPDAPRSQGEGEAATAGRHRQRLRPRADGAGRAGRADAGHGPLKGETGSGKDVFAEAIHDLSPRHNEPMVRVNCAAVPGGAHRERAVRHDAAPSPAPFRARSAGSRSPTARRSSSTKIGELPLDIQVKLLRVLQERESSASEVRSRRSTPGHRRDQPRSRAGGRRRAVPGGPVLPAERLPDSRPAAARTRQDIPSLVWTFVAEFSRSFGTTSSRYRPRACRRSANTLARQRPGAAERHRARRDHRQRPHPRRSSSRSRPGRRGARACSSWTSRPSTSNRSSSRRAGGIRGSGWRHRAARASSRPRSKAG